MSKNQAIRQRTAQALEDGGIFAFGLSEKTTARTSTRPTWCSRPAGDGWRANGRKYYIGNGNEAAIVSTFGRIAGSDEYVFFAADPRHERYRLIKNVVASQNYVSEFELRGLSRSVPVTSCIAVATPGMRASTPSTSASTTSAGPSIGICTHAFYEAITPRQQSRPLQDARHRLPHVRQNFVDAYCRLVAMKLFALRAADYMRVASPEDRRYLLYNPMVKMKVTTQGEDVINLCGTRSPPRASRRTCTSARRRWTSGASRSSRGPSTSTSR
jgi:acyl-CoA dehydrogenase